MSKEYYQMGWTLDEQYNEDYYFSKDNHKYFIKRNATPIVTVLSIEGIVPKLRWTKRLINGDVLIAQDFENGRTFNPEDMTDKRIPYILKKVHNSQKIKKIMKAQGYKEETAESLLYKVKHLMSEELRRNKDIVDAILYLEKNLPSKDIEYCPCHADLHNDNWLLSDKNKLFLVDWEEVILGDPAIDISFILYRYIPQKNWKNWLSMYGQELTLSYRLRLKWYIIFQTIIMVIWYNEKKQFSNMNNWLVFLNKIFYEFI